MPMYRVGEAGLRVVRRDGSESRYPAGTTFDEAAYMAVMADVLDMQGNITKHVERKRRRGYPNKMLTDYEDK